MPSVHGLARAASVTPRQPVGTFHHRVLGVGAVLDHEFFDVARQVAHPERAHAPRKAVGGSPQIPQGTSGRQDIDTIGVAGAGVAAPTIGVGTHLFTLTGEVPFALAADAFALRGADALSVAETLVIGGQLLAGVCVLVLIDAEAHGAALLGQATRLGILGTAKLGVASVGGEVAQALLLDDRAVHALDQQHAVGAMGLLGGRAEGLACRGGEHAWVDSARCLALCPNGGGG